MMYIIDTHILLWAFYDSAKLSDRTKRILSHEKCAVSIA